MPHTTPTPPPTTTPDPTPPLPTPLPTPEPPFFVELQGTGSGGQAQRIECQWVGDARSTGPVVVFLHEGLGSVALWRGFPHEACVALGRRGLVYSRPGYGQSTPRAAGEHWQPAFMHHQAHVVLPSLLSALDVSAPVDLVGHSDGGSIALLFAAKFSMWTRACTVFAPHLFVEPVTLASIREAAQAYARGELKARLVRYHADVDSAFGGWCGVWLNPAFEAWNIESELAPIRCPVLAVQGHDDAYGSMAQIDRLLGPVPQAQLLKLARCGHSPHRDQPQAVIDALRRFLV